MVPINDALAPLPTVGLPVVVSGGQAVAHAPVQALFVPESFWNRYRVRPCESTRIFPRRLLATRTAATRAIVVFFGGFADALVPPPPPQPAAASAASGITAAPARMFMGLLRVMRAPLGRL